MRPIRFVAISEDGQALVLADEVGRLLALPIDDRVHAAMRTDRGPGTMTSVPPNGEPVSSSLAPRDIQARIRAGDSADDVARVAGVPVDRVLRYAGPVLQERAMLAQHARRTKLRSSGKGQSLAEVVDGRLAQHGVDAEKISWDAYRRDDGTWRIVATWPSGKATAQAVWELDKARQVVTPHDDMAQYLCADRPIPILGQEPANEWHGRGLSTPPRPETGRSGHEPMRPAADTARRETRPGRGLGPDPIRAGRDALIAGLERPLGSPAPSSGRGLDPHHPAVASAAIPDQQRSRPAGGAGSVFDDDPDAAKEVPAVPSLAVLRPRRSTGTGGAAAQQGNGDDKPRKRLPSWDDVLFGSGPAARETS